MNLSQKIGDMNYDNLFAGVTPTRLVGGGIIRKLSEKATLARGTVLARSSGTGGDGKLVVLGTSPVSNETLTADCILCDDIEVGTTADEKVAVYIAGCFNTNKLTVKDGHTITDAEKDALRVREIILKASTN